MNLLTYRQPTHIYRSDSCDHGLGDFLGSGRAWRWPIPNHLRSRADINLLEFLGSIICVWIDIVDKAIPTESCILSMGNNTSAMVWTRKSNFKSNGENDTGTVAKPTSACHLSQIYQEASSCIYTQWFPGEDNDVSDFLSRDHHLSTTVLTNLLSSSIHHQLPPNLKISPLLSVIDSWFGSLLVKMTVKKAQLVQTKMILIAAGAGEANY